MRVRVNDKVLDFVQAPDGWYEATHGNYAINPEKTICQMDPWYADYITDAPKYEFEILEDSL